METYLAYVRWFVNQIHKTDAYRPRALPDYRFPSILGALPHGKKRRSPFSTPYSVLVPSHATLVRPPPAAGSDHRKLVALLKCASKLASSSFLPQHTAQYY